MYTYVYVCIYIYICTRCGLGGKELSLGGLSHASAAIPVRKDGRIFLDVDPTLFEKAGRDCQ